MARSRPVVVRVGRVEVGEFPQQTVMEHAGAGAMLTDVVSLVRHDDHRPVTPLLEQLAPAFLVEARVADRDDLIDQEAVELDSHRDGEGEPRAHTGGKGFHGFPEVFAQLREFLDEGQCGTEVGAVDPADEANVVEPGQASLECAAEGEGPGDRHFPGHPAAVRQLRAADDAYEGGLSRAVPAEDAELVALADFHADSVQNGVCPSSRPVALDDVLQADHSPSTVTETRFALSRAIISRVVLTTTR